MGKLLPDGASAILLDWATQHMNENITNPWPNREQKILSRPSIGLPTFGVSTGNPRVGGDTQERERDQEDPKDIRGKEQGPGDVTQG